MLQKFPLSEGPKLWPFSLPALRFPLHPDARILTLMQYWVGLARLKLIEIDITQPNVHGIQPML